MKLAIALSTLLASAQASRELSQEPLGSFSPITQVTDHAAIDLDQAEIELLLAEGNFGAAQAVYENGANSKSVASLAMTSTLPVAVPAGTTVVGVTPTGDDVSGKVYADAAAGATTLQVQYDTSDDKSNHVACRVGASATPFTAGCFAASGSVTVNSVAYDYSYSIEDDNFNGRTIQGFSTSTNKHRVFGDATNDFYYDFNLFQSYYRSTTYADDLVTAALTGTNANLSRGNQDYTGLENAARVEGAKKGAAYLNIFMYVIRELEDAIDDCNKGCDRDDCNDDAVHALDEAVAFYAGSTQGNGADGNLLYALANKRCLNFGTCSTDSNSMVNEQIFVQFKQMQNNLLQEECSAARLNKDRIAQLMYVPMIQGTLRYAYFQDVLNDATAKSNAEGAAFMAAILPKLHACNADRAAELYDMLRLGSDNVDFAQARRLVESQYGCMQITCEDVGGLTDGENYFDGAAPCSGQRLNTSMRAVVSLASIGGTFVFLGLGFLLCRSKKSGHSSNGVEKQLEMNAQNIA